MGLALSCETSGMDASSSPHLITPEVTPATDAALVIEIWADLVCPWCYLAKRRIRGAIAAYELPATIQLRHRAYELEPGMPPGRRVPVIDYLGAKYGGGRAGGEAMTARVAGLAAADGIELDFAAAVKCSTFDGHRLVLLAEAMGGWQLGQAMLERAYAAHFEQGLALDDHGVLVRIAAEAGLDERRVASVLAGDDYADRVRADQRRARELGVTGVPFAVAGDRVSVSGAQSVEIYVELIRQGSQR